MPVNDFEYVTAYGSTYLLLVGGETANPMHSPSIPQDFLQSQAKVIRVNNGTLAATDSYLTLASTLANGPARIVKYDLNGDGILDFVIPAFGPDAGTDPGSNSVVLESSPSGWVAKNLPFNLLAADGVAIGNLGAKKFLYFSVSACGPNNWSPQLVIRDTNGTYSIDNTKIPSYLQPTLGGPTCTQQEYLGATAFDVDGDGNDDLILGTSDDATKSLQPSYVGSVVLFGNGTDLKSRSAQLPPTVFNQRGVKNTTVQIITPARISNTTYLLVSYYQANTLGNPSVGGGIQLLKYDTTSSTVVDVTNTSFSGHVTSNTTGTAPYAYGGPFNTKFIDVNSDGCLDIVTSRTPGLWVSDCHGSFVWAFDKYLAPFVTGDKLFMYDTGTDASFVIPSSNDASFTLIKRLQNIPTPVNGSF